MDIHVTLLGAHDSCDCTHSQKEECGKYVVILQPVNYTFHECPACNFGSRVEILFFTSL